MSMARIAALDTDTTGLDPETCEVVEIGCTIIDVEFTVQAGSIPAARLAPRRARTNGE